MSIENIIASGDFNQPVNLDTLVNTPNIEIIYNPRKYHGAYLVIESKKVTIYKSGKYIINGLKRIEDIERFFALVCHALEPILDVTRFSPPQIRNIVITEKLNYSVNLNSLIQEHSEVNLEYEPEQFPAIICKRKEGTIILFRTGKMVLAGLKKVEDAKILKSFILDLTGFNEDKCVEKFP